MARTFSKDFLTWSLTLTVFLIWFGIRQVARRLNNAPSRVVDYRDMREGVGQYILPTYKSNLRGIETIDETVKTKNIAHAQSRLPRRFLKPRRSRWRWKNWSPAACSSRSISTRRQRIATGCQLWIKRLSFTTGTSREAGGTLGST